MAKILIVDDDHDFVDSISMALKSKGHEIAAKFDTKDLVLKIEDEKPDLVILDVMFPEDDSAGFDAARVIRKAKSPFKDIPVLMLTAVNKKFPLGFSDKDIGSEWMPVTDFIEKPVDFDELTKKIDSFLDKPEMPGRDSPEY